MKIIQNTLKIEEKSSDVHKIRVGPKKEGSVGFPETGIFFFFFCLTDSFIIPHKSCFLLYKCRNGEANFARRCFHDVIHNIKTVPKETARH